MPAVIGKESLRYCVPLSQSAGVAHFGTTHPSLISGAEMNPFGHEAHVLSPLVETNFPYIQSKHVVVSV